MLLENRRRKAAALSRQGRSISEISAKLGATPQAVGRWLRAYHHSGAEALVAKPVPGRPCKLSLAQKRRLLQGLLSGAEAAGFATDLWTCPRVRQLICDQTGVCYHVDHIPRLLSELDFSPSKAAD
jgi:transposase